MNLSEAKKALQDAGPSRTAEILLLVFRDPAFTPEEAAGVVRGMTAAIASATLEDKATDLEQDPHRMYGALQVVAILRASARSVREAAGIQEKPHDPR